jgi:crotonobetainyl-CoA:carnitine CoA-transferase CaiB-like acyl-CoA transferase
MPNVGRDAPLALAGIKAVELPCLDAMPFLAVAMAGKAFADHGAEVIKVEPPGTGAQERRLGPFRDDRPDPETGGVHLYLNTNKLGVTLNLAHARSRAVLHRLLADADVVFNPNAPAASERLGIDYRSLCARFPRLVVLSLTHFGTDSPYRDLRGGDLIATHMSAVGFETPFNQVTDPPAQPPLKIAGRQSDYLCGFTAAAAAMCALFARKHTGAGQHVDVSQWLAMVSMVRPSIGTLTHESPGAPAFQRVCTRRKTIAQWVYPCKDGWVSFSAATDRFWRGAKRAFGNPEWADNEMFDTLQGRVENIDAIEAALVDWLSTQTRDEAFHKAQAEHVPCFPVHSPKEVAHNAQYEARGFFVDCNHPRAGTVRMPGGPCQMSATPWRIRRAAPRLGEHNRRIYGEQLRLSEHEMRTLADDGVI